MAKQYVITEAEFAELLQDLELHKYKGSDNLLHFLEREIEQRVKTGMWTGESRKLLDLLQGEGHRTFHYHVYKWIQKVKE